MKQPRKRAWWDDEVDLPKATEKTPMSVYEEPLEWSGLYDAQGRKLMRQRPAFGFRR